MFAKILQWIRERLSKMIGTNNVKDALNVDIAMSPWMTSALILWSEMYVGRGYWVTADNPQAMTRDSLASSDIQKIRSMNLPAGIASEIARAVTIEMKVEVSGGKRGEYLDEQLQKIVPKLREKIEYGCAKGGLMLKPYVDGDEICVDFVQADQFYPVSFDANGNITAVVFSDTKQVGKYYYTRLESHKLSDTGYHIKNMCYKSTVPETLGNEVPLTEIEEWATLAPDTTLANVDKALFGYFRFPQANHIDPTSPLGVSCYSRAVQLIESADTQWSDLLWEFDSGRRALYVDSEAFAKDPKTQKPVLPHRRLYRTLNATGSVDKDNFFEDWSPTFREVSLLNGLNAILQKIEFECGLARGTLSDADDLSSKTATEIKIHKQRTYATITDTQKALQDSLDQLLYAMDVWATIYGLAEIGDFETSYDFDDSVITDHDVQLSQDMQVVGASLMPKYEFRMRNYGETEIVAKQKIAEIAKEQMEAMSVFQPTAPTDSSGDTTGATDTGSGNPDEQPTWPKEGKPGAPIRRIVADQ